MQQIFGAFLELLRQRRQSESTIRSAGFAFSKLDAFLKTEGKVLPDVTADDMDRFGQSLTEQGLALVTADLILRHVRRLFHWLAGSGRIFLDPAKGWSLSKPVRNLPHVPSEEDVALLLAQPDLSRPKGVRDRALIETAYSTGARVGELCRMSVHDADLEHGLLRVMGKGGKERMLPLGREAVRWLRQYVMEARANMAGGWTDNDRLWLGQAGRPISDRGVRMMLRQYAQRAGLPTISPHGLRRACATHMLRRGAHPTQIQLLLGHADTGTLGPYLRLTIRDISAMHAAGTPGQ